MKPIILLGISLALLGQLTFAINDEKYIDSKLKAEIDKSQLPMSIVGPSQVIQNKMDEKLDAKLIVPILDTDSSFKAKIVDDKDTLNSEQKVDVKQEEQQPQVQSSLDSSVNSENLKPIPPIMPFMIKFPSFIDSIIKSKFDSFLNPSSQSDLPIEAPESEKPKPPVAVNRETVILKNNKRPNSLMSVILVKTSHNNNINPDEINKDVIDQEPKQPIAIDPIPNINENKVEDGSTGMKIAYRTNFMIFRLIPKKFSDLFGGDTDIDSKLPDFENEKQNQHLLGGPSDIDFKRFGNGLIGADDLVHNSDLNSASDEDLKFDDDFKDSHKNGDNNNGLGLFNFPNFFQFNSQEFNNNNGGLDSDSHIFIRTDDGSSAFISNDIGQNKPPMYKKKCMMLSFMKLKASVYYKTIVNLLVASGFILVALLLSLLMIRLCKRRRMLRYYSNNMNVATIDDSKKQFLSSTSSPSKLNLFLFRTGIVRGSYSQKKLDNEAGNDGFNYTRSSSLLIPLPPTYDQAVSNDLADNNTTTKTTVVQLEKSKIENNPLANVYKNLQAKSNSDDDTKSLSSLPPYEEFKSESK